LKFEIDAFHLAFACLRQAASAKAGILTFGFLLLVEGMVREGDC
jgi:hypothetical protein